MKIKFNLIFVVAITIGCSTREGLVDNQSLGIYEISGFNSSVTLELKPDGEFVYQRRLSSCLGGSEVHRIQGDYTINQDKLSLIPKSLVDLDYFGFDDNDFKKDSMRYYFSDSTSFKSEFQIFKWDSLTYLLSEEYYSDWGFKDDENDYERLSDYYNSGYEPRMSSSYLVKRRVGYVPKTRMNVAKLPAKYRDLFLQKPIVGEILEIERIEIPGDSGRMTFVNHYKLNRGRRDGVKEKMVFYGDDGCCTITVTSVDDRISYGRLRYCYDYQADCGKGGRVTTYLERENGML
jgi:hypothetical protein